MSKLNPGIPYDKCFEIWFTGSRSEINLYSVNDSVASLIQSRGKTKESQIASLLRAVTCLDLTTLSGDDCVSNVKRLCYKAVHPIKKEILERLGFNNPSEISCAAVCVYPKQVCTAVETLRQLDSQIPVAAVAAGFPSGQYHQSTKLKEIELCVEDGAQEIDIVINREFVLSGQWKRLYDEVKEMGISTFGNGHNAKLKAIIAAGELGSLTNVYKASLICMAAGADFVKTSTGKESVNATLAIGTVMARALRDYYEKFGYQVGFKPAGGIRTAKDVLLWQELMAKELDKRWLYPDFFRIGASSLLGDIEQTVTQYVTESLGKESFSFL